MNLARIRKMLSQNFDRVIPEEMKTNVKFVGIAVLLIRAFSDLVVHFFLPPSQRSGAFVHRVTSTC